MKIKNLTSRVQALPILEIVGGRDYTIYVEGNGTVELCECYVADIDKYEGVFQVVKDVELVTPTVSVDEDLEDLNDNNDSTDDITPPEDTVDENESSDVKESEILDSKFICDICGAEFGSARGLNSHKNRVHLDEQ